MGLSAPLLPVRGLVARIGVAPAGHGRLVEEVELARGVGLHETRNPDSSQRRTIRTLPDGTVEEICEGYQGTLGGAISEQGSSVVRGTLDVVRNAAGAVLGIPAAPASP